MITPDDIIIMGKKPTEEDLYWLDKARNLTDEEIAQIYETARQQISIINTLMTGGYFAIVSLSSIKESINIVTSQKWPIILIIISPMLCWLFSLVNAYSIFLRNPRYTHADCPTEIERIMADLLKGMRLRIKFSIIATLLGFVLLVLNVILYLGFIPLKTTP